MSNWFPIGKVGANTTYTSKELCELTEGQECFEVSGVDVEISKVVEVDVPVMIEVIKERIVKDELGNDVVEQYGELEQAVDELGAPIFEKQKQIVVDDAKKAIKDADKAAKDKVVTDNAILLANLKASGSKDIKDLIKVLGL
jgi:hypothetical protein